MRLQPNLKDSFIRNAKSNPMGRIVLSDDSKYIKGASSIQVAVLKIMKVYCSKALGFEFYLDGLKYKVPDKLNPVKVRKNESEWIVTNFIAERV